MTTSTSEPIPVVEEPAQDTPWSQALGWSPYTGQPASIRDIVAYTRAGGWITGEHPWWMEAPGYGYGALIAIPGTVVLYTAAWLLQRPTRLLVAVFIALLLWWAAR